MIRAFLAIPRNSTTRCGPVEPCTLVEGIRWDLFLVMLPPMLTVNILLDCFSSDHFFPCHGIVSRSAEKSADRYRPACVKSPAHMRRLGLATLHQGNNQGGPSLGSCCSPGFATFRVERWCLRKLLYPKRNDDTWQHLVHISKFYLHKLNFNNPHRAIAHDAEVYPDPFLFDPSRYLGDKPQLDPFKFIFGFGKRICPGIHLAELSLFLNMTHILALFDISKPVDGDDVESKIDWTSSIISYVSHRLFFAPFKLMITNTNSFIGISSILIAKSNLGQKNICLC